eukprot:190732-Chlamydomonas_euryale.AAC.5
MGLGPGRVARPFIEQATLHMAVFNYQCTLADHILPKRFVIAKETNANVLSKHWGYGFTSITAVCHATFLQRVGCSVHLGGSAPP